MITSEGTETSPLAGARVAVLGASGVLGGRISRSLASRGARLLLAGRDPDRLGSVGVQDASVVEADIRDPACGTEIAEAAKAAFGGLVNAAGVVAFGTLAEHDDDTIEELFLTASLSVYAATKAALAAADVALARELRRVKVRVIDAKPPHTETGLAGRAIFGVSPPLPEGLAPETVAERIVHAIESGEKSVPSIAFQVGQ